MVSLALEAALEKDPAAPLNRDDRSGKYLVFQLGSEEFGIRVLQVREIMGVQDITSLPQTPAHVPLSSFSLPQPNSIV